MDNTADICVEKTIIGLGDIIYSGGYNFDKASKAVLAEKHFGLISMRDLAYSRIIDAHTISFENEISLMNASELSSLCQYGSYVKEGSLFIPKANNKRILLSHSLVLDDVAGATNAHSWGNLYFPKIFDLDEYLELAGENHCYTLTDNDLRKGGIPTDKFDEFGSMNFCLKDQAKEYGLLMHDLGIFSINFELYNDVPVFIDMQTKPFANQLYIYGLTCKSTIAGSYGCLEGDNRVRGLCKHDSSRTNYFR
jgi:hypothetical protein